MVSEEKINLWKDNYRCQVMSTDEAFYDAVFKSVKSVIWLERWNFAQIEFHNDISFIWIILNVHVYSSGRED